MTAEIHADARVVTLRRTEFGTYEATNERGGTLVVGEGHDETFTPVELLLTAIAGCASIDVDYITARRAEPVSFDVTSSGVKSTEGGNHLTDLHVTFRVVFPEGEAGDAARARVPQAVRRSAESLCTVSRTIQLGTPVVMDVAD
nr:OsmC family protein [Propionibacterium sp.]